MWVEFRDGALLNLALVYRAKFHHRGSEWVGAFEVGEQTILQTCTEDEVKAIRQRLAAKPVAVGKKGGA